mmetsp:Transcript_22553/g.71540  ORF Transcript_22553/g.71540 Transcript_22553/m.71540 type:complete len:202 (+) Transcript_22553:298-903(+)
MRRTAALRVSSARPSVCARRRIRSSIFSSSQTKCSASSGRPHCASKSIALSRERGKPSSSSRRPPKERMRRRSRVTMSAEETSSPRSMMPATSRPSGVSASTSERSRSPQETCETSHSSTRRRQRTPLPLPGPPTTRIQRAGFEASSASEACRNSSRSMAPLLSTSAWWKSSSSVASSGLSPTLASSARRPSRSSCLAGPA